MLKNYQKKDFLRKDLNWSGPEGSKENGFCIMREIGLIYKTTSHEVGAMLEQLKYRDGNGHPTSKAFSGRFVAPRGDTKFTWAWDKEKTCQILDDVGWERA